MVRLESVTISVFGALLGLAVGLVFAVTLQRVLADDGIDVLRIPVGQLTAYVVAAAVIGVLAALWPAYKASLSTCWPPSRPSDLHRRPTSDVREAALRVQGTITSPAQPLGRGSGRRSLGPRDVQGLRDPGTGSRGRIGQMAPGASRRPWEVGATDWSGSTAVGSLANAAGLIRPARMSSA